MQTMLSPLSQPSSSSSSDQSDESDSIIYEDLLSENIHHESTYHNNTKANPNAEIVYKPDNPSLNGQSSSSKNPNNKHHIKKRYTNHNNNNNGYIGDHDENDNDENITVIRELSRHPWTPRPHKLEYDSPSKSNNKNKKHSSKKMSSISSNKHNNFSSNTLGRIRTPRPESVGIDSTDDEYESDDGDDSDAILPPGDDATIAEEDEYTLKQKKKWIESQKGPTYHAYTTGQLDNDIIQEEEEEKIKKVCNNNNNNKNNKDKYKRGAEYFPEEELDGRYEFIRYLGHGAYGYVAEGKHIKTGKKVAIKKILKIFHNRI
eukprot:961879_1